MNWTLVIDTENGVQPKIDSDVDVLYAPLATIAKIDVPNSVLFPRTKGKSKVNLQQISQIFAHKHQFITFQEFTKFHKFIHEFIFRYDVELINLAEIIL